MGSDGRLTSLAAKVRHARLAVILTAVGLGCVAAVTVAADEASKPAMLVRVDDGLLSVQLDEAPLEAVLEAIAAQTEVVITLRGDLGAVRPQAFSDVPLGEGIRRLVDEHASLMIYEQPTARGAAGRLRELRVHGQVVSDEATPGDRARSQRVRTLRQAPNHPPPAPLPTYQELALKAKGERLGAIRKLARREDEAALEVLGALVAQDPDATVRRIAATALSNLGGEDAAAALEVGLGDQDADVRIQAMRGLQAIEREDGAERLGALALGDDNPEIRRQAVHLLGTLRSAEAWSTIESATSDPDDAVRAAAGKLLDRPRRGR